MFDTFKSFSFVQNYIYSPFPESNIKDYLTTNKYGIFLGCKPMIKTANVRYIQVNRAYIWIPIFVYLSKSNNNHEMIG